MKSIIILSFLLNGVIWAFGQDAPNLANMTSLSGNTQEASKLSSVPVNIYTGAPNVSVPIYSYSNAGSGLSWGVSLEYYAGGAQVGEASSTVGLGWFFNCTGVITRTVRGMPDDVPGNGYLYAPAIPSDFRSNANKYYYDSLDAEQDIFQFSFNGRSGQFLIGKNKQIILLPNSKMTVSYSVSSIDNSSITAFRIITEDGVKYDFANEELTSFGQPLGFNFGFETYSYGSAWYLSDIISSFNTDTIKFNYTGTGSNSSVTYPQVEYVRNSDGVHTATYQVTAPSTVSSMKLSSIVFPDKRSLTVVYSNADTYNNPDFAVGKIKIADSIFRYGFALGYTSVANSSVHNLYLSSVTPYTSREMQRGYSFSYNTAYVPYQASDFCEVDYWGFYNGASNGTNLIPQEGSISGANRAPNVSYAIDNSLAYYYLPGGGFTYYQYELNDHYPYTKSFNTLSIAGNTNTQNSIALSQVFGTRQLLVFNLDPSVSRSGGAPISGTGSLTCNIMSADGTIQYATTSFSLYDLFYSGSKTWSFNAPANGTYLLQTQLSGGTTITGSFPINVTWENKQVDNAHTAIPSGGLRVKRIIRKDDVDDPNISTEDFQYLTADGKSSGFLGDTASYSYPYSETVVNGGTTNTAYTVVSSAPLNTLNYSQGSPVGYSRVIVYKGSTTHNIGYTVYDFTSLSDVNANLSTYIFPYTPQDTRNWGLGLPKRVSVYDSSGNLIKRQANTYRIDTMLYNTSSNFLSVKLGNTFTLYNGDPSITSTPRIKTYIGQQYYPSTGRAYVTATTDTLYQTDGSLSTSYKNYIYDTNYNVTKVVTGYDRTRGLQLETRLYYPYNYIIGGAIGTLRTNGIITPVIASESWITGDANPRMTGGSIVDYQQLTGGYVKPLTAYSLQSNAPVAQAIIGLFDSSKLVRNSTYFVAQASFPVYDNKGNLLQTTNLVGGQSSSLIRDYNNEYPIAKVSNAAYSDIAYTSFESDGSGNWTIGSSTRDYSGGLTGKLAYNLSNGNITKSGLNTALTYIVSVWAKNSASVAINGVTQSSPIAQQNGWNLFFTTLTGISSVTISGTGTIDELRLHPKDANMATDTYEPLIGITSSCDANNTVAYSTYDNMNRVKLIKDKDLNVIKRLDYSDKDSLISTAPVISRSAVFQWDPNFPCGYDSVITTIDTNPWSDSYQSTNTTTVLEGYNYCTCSSSANYPQYKIVNGACELGIKQYSSSILHAGVWISTYHYIWSDCSVSGNYSEDDSTAQTVTSGCSGIAP